MLQMQNVWPRFKRYRPVFFLWLYRATLIALFFAAWHFRTLLPPPPFSDPDTPGYLSPALQLLTTGVYGYTWRGFPYPLFLTLILKICPQLEAIAWTQHALGLATAALILLIFLRLRAFFPKGQILDWATRLVILVAVAVTGFCRFVLVMEHSIRPEALFSLVSAGTLLLGVEFSRRALLRKETDWISSILGSLLIVAAVGTYYVKPAWGLALGTTLLPLYCAWIWIPRNWKWKLITTCTGIILALIGFVFPSLFLQKQYIANTCGYLPPALLCTHAEFLADIMQKDALLLPPESQKRIYLLKFVEDTRKAMLRPSSERYGLALDPNDIMYGGPMDRLLKALQKNGDSFPDFCYYYYFRGWKEHPLPMLGKIAKQMEFFYAPGEKNVYDISAHLPLAKQYRNSLETFLDARNDYVALSSTNTYGEFLHDPKLATLKPLKLPVRGKLGLLNEIFLPILLLALGGAAIVLLSKNHYSELRPAALCMLYLASFNFANSLTISIIYMMDIDRYHYNQISMSLVSQGFGFLFLLAMLKTTFGFLKFQGPSRHIGQTPQHNR
ncbi:MAG: hypothetical protein C5B47_02645 [Verrucomicrobia bacterium]|nr:MAG: hypothetical protein C5B47_02645 [Verrucomicrobiota bacterium]